MRNTESLFIQKPLNTRLASFALLLLALPFAALAVYIALTKAPVSGFPLVLVFSEEDAKKLLIFAAALAVVDFALFFAFFSRISGRLAALARVIKDISREKYTNAPPPETPDEIGLLCDSVNELSAALKAEKTRRIYKLNYAGKQSLPGRPAGDSRFAAALFISIEKWSDKAYLVSGKRLIAVLSKYYEIVSNCACRTDGIIESHFDSEMSVFWSAHGQAGGGRDVYNCVRCALLIRHAVYQYNNKQKNKAMRVKINMGINYGAVTTGIISVNGNPELKITGNNLDIARQTARAASECNFDILITGGAFDYIESHILAEPVPPPENPAAGYPDRVYALVNIKAQNRLKQTHPFNMAEVRKIMNW